MSEKRIFNVRYVEFPETTLFYDVLELDISIYPELEGKTDDEVVEYIKQNAWELKSTDPEMYDSLAEELQDMDLVREKTPHVDSEIWAEPSSDSFDEEETVDDEEDE